MTESTHHDESLMLQVADGNLDAFDEIVRRHQDWVWRVAFRFLGNKEEAEDIAQDTFLRLLAAAPRYKPTASLKTYLYSIISRLCLDCFRKKRPDTFDDFIDVEDSSPLPDHLIIHKQQAAAVRKAIALLPPNQRIAVILKYYEGLGYREIGAALDCTEKAAERLLARGRESLSITLSAQLKD